MLPDPTFQDYLKTYLTLVGLPKYVGVGIGAIQHDTISIVDGLHRRLNERSSTAQVPTAQAPSSS